MAPYERAVQLTGNVSAPQSIALDMRIEAGVQSDAGREERPLSELEDWMKVRVRLDGVTPLLLHSDAAAIPGHPLYEAKARLAAKHKKSTEDHQELQYLDFLSCFYPGDDIVIPSWNVARSIGAAAAEVKQKSASERALVPLEQSVPLLYEGPRTREELWAAGFSDTRMVKNSGVSAGRVPRCRPYFKEWAITADFMLDTRALELPDLRHHAEVAGELYGIGDARRLGFGRYRATVEEL